MLSRPPHALPPSRLEKFLRAHQALSLHDHLRSSTCPSPPLVPSLPVRVCATPPPHPPPPPPALKGKYLPNQLDSQRACKGACLSVEPSSKTPRRSLATIDTAVTLVPPPENAGEALSANRSCLSAGNPKRILTLVCGLPATKPSGEARPLATPFRGDAHARGTPEESGDTNSGKMPPPLILPRLH